MPLCISGSSLVYLATSLLNVILHSGLSGDIPQKGPACIRKPTLPMAVMAAPPDYSGRITQVKS